MLEVTTHTSFHAIPNDVARAASYESVGEIFESLEWMRCLYETVLRDEHELRLYAVRDDVGAPIGMVVCAVPFRSRRLIGLSNYYTLGFRPTLFAAGESSHSRRYLIDAVVAHMARERPRWRSIDFEHLRNDRVDADLLAGALRRHRFVTRRTHQYENWYLDVADTDFDGYFASRSSKLRNTITRKEKKIRKAHELEVRIFTDNDSDLADAIDHYVAVYERSWKEPEPYPDFTPTFIRTCADLAILRLGVAYLDGEPAAAQLWVNSANRTYIYKLAYDEAFADLSIGAVLSRELFRNAIDVDQVSEIDYGVGSDAYKRDWMSGVRTGDRLEAHRLDSLGGIAGLGGALLRRTPFAGAFRRGSG